MEGRKATKRPQGRKTSKKEQSSVQNDLMVARTNDESVVSKRSAARLEYFPDPFLAHFVRKPSRRAALINRGYYIRRKTVQMAMEEFARLTDGRGQVVSVGAGYDSTFFVLCTAGVRYSRYIEVDFAHVIAKKSLIMRNTPELLNLVEEPQFDDETKEIKGANYSLIGADITVFADLNKKLAAHGLDYSLPTLFLAECVFTYMSSSDSDRVIHWAASAPFPETWFVVYEQIRPKDAFGRTMTANLQARGSPLLGIESYPTDSAQVERYRKLGFRSVCVRTMLDMYSYGLPMEEKHRIESMEEFDEDEEWREKCSHYTVSISSTVPDRVLPFSQNPPASASFVTPPRAPASLWTESHPTSSGRSGELKRWGHSACVTSDRKIVVFGGYGGSGRHERMDSVLVIDPCQQEEPSFVLPATAGIGPSPRVLHAAAMMPNNVMVVYGGRAGPKTPFADTFTLDCARGAYKWERLVFVDGPHPPALFRHSLTHVPGTSLAILFGGRTGWRQPDFGEFWLLDVSKPAWRRLECASPMPVPRASHAAVWHDGALYIHGGTTLKDGQVLADLWRVTLNDSHTECRAECIDIAQLAPRFSHSAVSIGPHLYLTGGTSTSLENSVIQVNLEEKTALTYQVDEVWSRSRAVYVGNALYLVGGGQLCFSFGSAFCEQLTKFTFAESFSDGLVGPNAEDISVQKKSKSLSSGPEHRAIHRIENPTPEQFRDWVMHRREPCLFSASGSVPKWNKDDIMAAVPPETLASIHVCSDALLDFTNKNFEFQVVPFSEMLDRLEDSEQHLYFRSLGENARKDPSNVVESFPALAEKYLVPDFARDVVTADKIHSSCLRLSSQDVQMWTHYDINDNILSGVRGRKRLVLWHPEEIRHLYVDGTASTVLNVDDPDFNRFPAFAKAAQWHGTLEEGDVLFIPAMWWHNTRTLSPCYGVNVFFRHMNADAYQSKDLYGNKDPLLAQKAQQLLEQAEAHLSELPLEYRRFFARKLILDIKKSLL